MLISHLKHFFFHMESEIAHLLAEIQLQLCLEYQVKYALFCLGSRDLDNSD